MVRVHLSTVEYPGRVTIRCAACSTKAIYPAGAVVLVLEYRAVLGQPYRMVVIDAETGARLHDCRILRVWCCGECGAMPSALPARRGRVWTKCLQCGTELHQIEVPADPPLVPES